MQIRFSKLKPLTGLPEKMVDCSEGDSAQRADVCVESCGRNRKHSRSGMTLMELLLVVAIMVVVAAISVPAVHQVFARQALQKGADRLRVAMGQARVKAIRNGEEYAVFFMPNGAWFNVAPFYDFPQQQALAGKRQGLVDSGLYTDYESDLMPRGVLFIDGETKQDARASAASGDVRGTVGGGLHSILFYPDGTSQDARIILQNDKGNRVQVELRGLTGIAKSVRIEEEGNR